MARVLQYSARVFDLSEIEGLSQRTLQMHQQIYRDHVDAVNQLLAVARGVAPGTLRDSHSVTGPLPSRSPAPPAADLRFVHEYNGMVLHELFFEGLTGALGAIPPRDGAFRSSSDLCFGSFEAWKADLRQMAQNVRAGWVLCLRERVGQRIFNCRIDSHAIGMPIGVDVVLAIDLWEHAWLGDYGPAQVGEYLDAVLTQIDWNVVERRCAGDPRR